MSVPIYRIDWSGEDGHYVAWGVDRVEARSRQTEAWEALIQKWEGGGRIGPRPRRRDIRISEVQFPADPAGIVRWLNYNFSMDNG